MAARTSQKRSASTREAQERTPPSTVRRGKLSVPEDIIRAEAKKGFGVAWIALTVRNEPMDGNIEGKLMSGWVPLGADEYPKLLPPIVLPGRDKPLMIQRGGQILCRRPLADIEASKAALQAENMETLNSVNWNDGDNKVPQMGQRVTDVNQVKIERVVSSANAGFKE